MKDRFVRSDEFYLRDKNGKVTNVKSSKNAFTKSLPDFQEEVKQYLKKGKFDLTEPHDLIAVVSYYNALL